MGIISTVSGQFARSRSAVTRHRSAERSLEHGAQAGILHANGHQHIMGLGYRKPVLLADCNGTVSM